MIWIKGAKRILEAAESGKHFEKVVILNSVKGKKETNDILAFCRSKSVKVQFVPKEKLNSIDPNPNSIMGALSETIYYTIDELIDNEPPSLVVALDHIQDPQNLGAICRSCAAFGITYIILPKDRSATVTSSAIQASSGAINRLKLIKVVNLSDTLIKLKKAGYWVYASHVKSGLNLAEKKPAQPMVLVIGNEEKGVSQRVLQVADDACHIPMKSNFDSLNVSVATGILLYELSKHD